MVKLIGNDDPFIAATLSPDAVELWNSAGGQSLVQQIHPKQHRLLASMLNGWVRLIEIQEKMRVEEKENGSSLTTVMTGSDGYSLLVEHTLQKMLAKTEKQVRDAETKLGITLKELENTPTEDDDVPDFGS